MGSIPQVNAFDDSQNFYEGGYNNYSPTGHGQMNFGKSSNVKGLN